MTHRGSHPERTFVVKRINHVSSWGLAALAFCLIVGLAEQSSAEETARGIGKSVADMGALQAAPDSRGVVVPGGPAGLITDLPAAGAAGKGRLSLDQPGCSICLGVPASVTWNGNAGSFHADRIANFQSSGFSGPLDVRAVLTTSLPVFGGNIAYFPFSNAVSYPTLQAGFQYTGIDSGTIPFLGNTVPAGEYFLLLFLRQYTGGVYYYTDWIQMDKKVSCTGSACSPINPPASCTEDANTMCLVNGRYKVTSTWKNQYAGGATATLQKAKLTDVTGAFWIANASTYEYMIRVNTATDNGRAWMTILTFTSVEFFVDVTDTKTGQFKEYHSAPVNVTLIYDPTTFVYP